MQEIQIEAVFALNSQAAPPSRKSKSIGPNEIWKETIMTIVERKPMAN